MLAANGMRFPIDVTLVYIRWYAAYPLNYRHLEEMMQEPGVFVKHAARSVVSESRGLARGRSFDRVYAAEVAWEVPFAQAEAFTNWHDVKLLKEQRKASIPLPGVGGILARVVRFTAPMKREVIAEFGYRFSSSLQVSGTARA